MSYDYLKGRKCMVWTFMGNSRMYQALAAYGDRLSQVGLFSFKVSRTGVISESETGISSINFTTSAFVHGLQMTDFSHR